MLSLPVKRNNTGRTCTFVTIARKPRSNDTSGEFKSSVKDSKGEGMSMEQADRAQLKVSGSNGLRSGSGQKARVEKANGAQLHVCDSSAVKPLGAE